MKKVVLEVSGEGTDTLATFTEAAMRVQGVNSVRAEADGQQFAVEYNPNVASLYQIMTAAKGKGLAAKLVRVNSCCGFCEMDQKNPTLKSGQRKPTITKQKMANC